MYGKCIFVGEGQLYAKGLLGTARLGSPDWAAYNAAEIYPEAMGSITEVAPS